MPQTILPLVGALAALFSLLGCADNAKSSASAKASATPTPSPSSERPRVGPYTGLSGVMGRAATGSGASAAGGGGRGR